MHVRQGWTRPRQQQTGAVLFVALILLLILSMLGVTAARMQTVEERMARNETNRQIGQQAAESALRAAEAGIASGTISGTNIQTPILWDGSVLPPYNWGTALSYSAAPVSGPALTALPGPSQAPKLIVESLPPVIVAGGNAAAGGGGAGGNGITVHLYRVTAQGVGADGTSTTTLQTVVRSD